MESVQEGSAAKVKTLIAKGASTKAKDEAGNTALHFASQKDIAGMLISAGASVNTRNDDFGMTPLFNVPAEVAALLIAKGADVNARARKGMTPLSWAVYWDQKDKMALLISKGAEVNAKDDDGKTALHIAANWGKVDIAALHRERRGCQCQGQRLLDTPPLGRLRGDCRCDGFAAVAGADRNAVSCPSVGPSSPVETPLDVAQRFRSPTSLLT